MNGQFSDKDKDALLRERMDIDKSSPPSETIEFSIYSAQEPASFVHEHIHSAGKLKIIESELRLIQEE